MKLTEIMRLVWINIIQNKGKMIMTSLGIIVGAATIVLVIAIGQGGQADVADQFKNLNAGAIEITSGSTSMDGMNPDSMMSMMQQFRKEMDSGSNNRMSGNMGGMMGGGNSGTSNRMPFSTTEKLTQEDVDDISSLIPSIKQIALIQIGETDIFGGTIIEETQTETIVGVPEIYKDITNLSVEYGRFISDTDNDSMDYVCVIGNSLATELFGYPMLAYNDYLEIDGKNYLIVGVLSSMGSVSSGVSPDDSIYIPYTVSQKYVLGNSVDPQISAVASEVEDVPDIISDINIILKENYPNASFTVTDAGSAMDAASKSADTLALLLLAVAIIVFIVGGIGIMNVLFVSVQERTPEIGILKAIGCSKKTILLEFLAEANIISLIGGIVGVGLSFALIPLVEFTGIRTEPSVTGAVLALSFAVFTGTAFGFYPAYKASKLVPIEALNL